MDKEIKHNINMYLEYLSAVNDLFMTRRPKYKIKFSDKSLKVINSRQLKEFTIKGHKVMACSRKDAITRLKHLKKL